MTTTPDGTICVLESAVIPRTGFVHGFPTRSGGLSQGLRSSLNLGYRWGDERGRVDENRRLLADHVGFAIDELVVTKHVHGTRVWRVGDELPDPAEFDGLVSDRVGAILGAFAADCIPVLFAAPAARVCGACHAGWRGTLGGVGREVICRMVDLGAAAGDIRVALGPSIGPCCFEVGPEVVTAFKSALPGVDGLVVAGPRKDHIDLRRAMRTILEPCGIRPEHIDDQPPCTRCDEERFYSYRRDGKAGGVHMGFIGLSE